MSANVSAGPVCVALAGGGTGGHLAPALALAEELSTRLPEARLVFIGTGRPIEERMIVPAGYERCVMDAPRFPRSLREIPLFPFRLRKSIRRAEAILRELNVALVVGLGGYGSVPAVRAAHRLRVPSVLLEQNSIPGRANRWLSRVAREVYVQFESSRTRFRFTDRVQVLGNPLRRGITSGSRERVLGEFSLDSGLRTLLILGGSQGAQTINRAVCDALGELAAPGTLQLVHQTGSRDFEWVLKRHRDLAVTSHVSAFIDGMADALAAADLIVGRAGATTLAEIAAVGRPSVLVPYPHAADDHQRLNAEVFAEAGAAVVVKDAELDGPTLVRVVGELMQDAGRRAEMTRAALTLAKPNATADVCDRIVNFLRKPGT